MDDCDFRVTPLMIEMAMHYVCRTDPFPRLGAPACIDAQGWLFRNGLIDREDKMARATERCEAWLENICRTPLPVQEWRDPRFPHP